MVQIVWGTFERSIGLAAANWARGASAVDGVSLPWDRWQVTQVILSPGRAGGI